MSNKTRTFLKCIGIIYLSVLIVVYFLWAFIAMSWLEPINDTFLDRTGRSFFVGLSFAIMLASGPIAELATYKIKD